MILRSLFFAFSLYFAFVNTVLATVDSDLQSFFKNLGEGSNITAPHAYQGQQAGYYTGGSAVARNSVRNACQAIQKTSLAAGDEELAELLMSLSGSIIVKT